MSGREGRGGYDKRGHYIVVTAYKGAQPGVSMVQVRVMEGLQRRRKSGVVGGRKEGKKGAGWEGGGQACTNEPQKRVCARYS